MYQVIKSMFHSRFYVRCKLNLKKVSKQISGTYCKSVIVIFPSPAKKIWRVNQESFIMSNND